MKFDRFLFPLLLSASAAVTLGLSYVTSPAQDMPPLGYRPRLGATGDAGIGRRRPRQPRQIRRRRWPRLRKFAQAAPPAAPANPPTATAPASPPATAEPPAAAELPAAAEPPAAAESPRQAALAPATPTTPSLTQAELDQLLAPIALYPDQLLSQILMASTYPLEIVEAARWVKDPAHRRLKGDALTNALREQHWDPSVMALVPFPHVLELMNAQIEWTQKLGAAFVAQQADCMNEVQRLRQQAVAAGNFKSGQQCRCLVQQSGGYVTVAPANPQVVYAPVYDAAAIYGPWLYPAYPPFLFPYPVGFAFAPGFFIGFGFGVDVAFYGPLWGWGNFNWGGRNIFVNSVKFNVLSGGHTAFAGGVWTHDSTRASSIVSASATSRRVPPPQGAWRALRPVRRRPVAATSGHADWGGGHGASNRFAGGAATGGHGAFAGQRRRPWFVRRPRRRSCGPIRRIRRSRRRPWLDRRPRRLTMARSPVTAASHARSPVTPAAAFTVAGTASDRQLPRMR